MANKWKPDKARLEELEKTAAEYANSKGFETLNDSIAGASLATLSLSGHLFLTDDKLDEREWLGMVTAAKFLEALAVRRER